MSTRHSKIADLGVTMNMGLPENVEHFFRKNANEIPEKVPAQVYDWCSFSIGIVFFCIFYALGFGPAYILVHLQRFQNQR